MIWPPFCGLWIIHISFFFSTEALINISHQWFCILQEDEVPELEIDVDELLDLPSDVERAIRVKV